MRTGTWSLRSRPSPSRRPIGSRAIRGRALRRRSLRSGPLGARPASHIHCTGLTRFQTFPTSPRLIWSQLLLIGLLRRKAEYASKLLFSSHEPTQEEDNLSVSAMKGIPESSERAVGREQTNEQTNAPPPKKKPKGRNAKGTNRSIGKGGTLYKSKDQCAERQIHATLAKCTKLFRQYNRCWRLSLRGFRFPFRILDRRAKETFRPLDLFVRKERELESFSLCLYVASTVPCVMIGGVFSLHCTNVLIWLSRIHRVLLTLMMPWESTLSPTWAMKAFPTPTLLSPILMVRVVL
jgi:hypothetical protein